MNRVPVAVAELERRRRLEYGRDGTSTVVHREGHRTVDQLKDEIIASSLNGQQNARNVSRLYLHRDVKVEANSELSKGVNESARVEEVAGLDLLGAGDNALTVVATPFTHRSFAVAEVLYAANEARTNHL